MKSPALLALALTFLAGCSGSGPARDDGVAKVQANAVQTADPHIACATLGSRALEPVCTVEQVKMTEGLVLVLRAPRGGFRRLLVTKDGRGVISADGSEPARVSPIGKNWIDVAIGADRYRLPATVYVDG